MFTAAMCTLTLGLAAFVAWLLAGGMFSRSISLRVGPGILVLTVPWIVLAVTTSAFAWIGAVVLLIVGGVVTLAGIAAGEN